MRKIFYEKVGNKYVPVRLYNSDFLDSLPKGNHLIMCHPGITSTKINVDPNYVSLIAAGRVAKDKMIDSMVKASALQPSKTPITPGQQRAYKKLAKEFGVDLFTLQTSSIHDIVEAGINAMQEEALNLMKIPAIKNTYNQYLFVCELAKNHENIVN